MNVKKQCLNLEEATSLEQAIKKILLIIQNLKVSNKDITKVIIKLNNYPKLDLIRLNIKELKFYWENRKHTESFFCIGECLNFSQESAINFLEQNGEQNIYYIQKFSQEELQGSIWEKLPNKYIFLPLVEFFYKNNTSYLNLYMTKKNINSIVQILNCILKQLTVSHINTNINFSFKEEKPNYKKWEKIMSYAKSCFNNNEFKKVVLYRWHVLHTDSEFYSLLNNFFIEEDNFLSYFYFEMNDYIFFGRSPERLFIRNETKLRTEAIAGTHTSVIHDETLFNKKNLKEHQYVVQNIEDILEQHCLSYSKQKIKSIHLKLIDHLYQKYSGILKKGISNFDLIDIFHPTAALGGYPKQEALDFIKNHDQMDRGYYGAPIGWMSKHNAEFTVGIRSVLYSKKNHLLYLFSGAGIIAESDPHLEWEELNIKIKNILEALQVYVKS